MFEHSELFVHELELVSVMHTLADPSRLRMVAALDRSDELSCTTLGERIGRSTTKSTTSHHMAVLREAGIIQTRQVGQRKLATLRRAELDERFPGLLDAVIKGIKSLP